MDERIANPKMLGFLTLAVAGWIYSMPAAGWYPAATMGQPAAREAAVLAMLGLLIAAIASFMRGEAWYAVFFMFWSALFWAFHSAIGAMGGQASVGMAGWFYLALAVASCILWLGALRAALKMPVMLLALAVTIVFLGFALGLWIAPIFMIIGGYAGLVAALLAFWAGLSELPGGSAPASASAM